MWDAFLEQCLSEPERVAVRLDDGEAMTYRQLRAEVIRVRDLVRHVHTGSAIAIASSDPLVALVGGLAANSAGCAFAPIDPSQPERRQAAMLRDLGAPIVLRRGSRGHDYEVEQCAELNSGQDFDEVAYVLYTSGSTGEPKGVVIGHDAILKRFEGLAESPGLHADSAILALTNPAFDISIAETFLPLTLGAAFLAPPPHSRYATRHLEHYVAKHRPTVVQATPSWWRFALAAGWKTRVERIWCGGEQVTPALAAQLLGVTDALWNVYGPTEASIWCSAYRVEDAEVIRLGSPLLGTRFELEHKDGAAELVITGAGLARGYLNKHDATHRAFRFDEYGAPAAYRTGDRVQVAADGGLEFKGRWDRQVKVRGLRIELGEIENALEMHASVHECAVEVVDRVEDGDSIPTLVAYFAASVALAPEELRAWLVDLIPALFVPSRYRQLESLPRNSAGKINRVQLGLTNDRGAR